MLATTHFGVTRRSQVTASNSRAWSVWI